MQRYQKSFLTAGYSITLLLLAIFCNPNLQFAQTSSLRTADNGNLIFEAESLLAQNGYWITKVDNIKDASTYHAVVAFQKVERRKINGILTADELKAIRVSSRPRPAYTGKAHIEVDISRQVLFLVDDLATVTHILPVSTGSGEIYYEKGKRQIANTPRGIFSITRQIKGVRRAPLGTLYHPNYFYEGVAIHGSNSIPFYPASHGCVRIPRFAASKFSDLVFVGMKVFVYDDYNRTALKEFKRNEIQMEPCKTDS